MEVGQCKQQLLIFSWLIATLIVFLSHLVEGTLEIGLEALGWFIGELDTIL
jgi:hypothetical protein